MKPALTVATAALLPGLAQAHEAAAPHVHGPGATVGILDIALAALAAATAVLGVYALMGRRQ